ncbi:MAG TPA: alpha/beta hydrolase [Planctomycetota bacterium]|nr:alpha/beta hydrolase [Planctomycetota bacterium]
MKQARALLCAVVAALAAAATSSCASSSHPTRAEAHGSAAAVQTGHAPVNGLSLYYEIHGANTELPPLVLLHGGGSTIESSFAAVLPSLARKRQVIAFEQQGHGHTADVDRPFSFEQSADDAAALLAHLGLERADFFGYSNGGSIALQIAMRHPSLVRRLVVQSAMFRRDGLVPGFFESMDQAKVEDMPAELREAYLRVAPKPENLQSFHDKCAKRMIEFKDWPDEWIRGVEAPTLVMVGDADVVTPEHAVRTFRLLPHAQLAILPGTDHMSIVKRADWQVSMIEAFLQATF